MTDDDHREFLHLVTNRRAAEPQPYEPPDEAVALGNAFATVKGQRTAAMLEFRRKDGSDFAVPYGYRPILWRHPPDTILIEYPGFFTVAITCKGYEELFRRIGDQSIAWIRECDDAAGLPVAVTRIEILRAYPSREVGTAINAGAGETESA